MTAVATGISGPRTPRWMVVTLVGSLALNLVVIGATASSLWRRHLEAAEAPPSSRRVPPKVVAYVDTLPAERVKELERRTEAERKKVLPLRRALLKARAESVKALAAEPFDRQVYLAAQAELVVADQRSREAAFKLESELSLNLTPGERRGFPRWLEQQQPLQNPLDVPEKQPGETQR